MGNEAVTRAEPRGLVREAARRIGAAARRQKVAVAISGALGAAIVLAAAVAPLAVTVALVGLVGVSTVLAVLRLQRLSKEVRAVALRSGAAIAKAEASILRNATAQRRMLDAIEAERLATAERYQALTVTLHENRNDEALQEGRVALENLRQAMADQHLALTARIENVLADQGQLRSTMLDQLSDIQKAIIANQQRLQNLTAKVQRDQTREVEALLQLFRDFRPRAPMPSSGGGWALNPTCLLELLFHIRRHSPKLVVELGSGASSVWISYALEEVGGRLVSLDHESQYAEQTRSMVLLHELDKVADVRLAQLCPVIVDGESYLWYDIDALVGVDGIELLLVDGPPGKTGPMARYPALPVLEQRLAANAMIVLDDVDRAEEQAILNRWTSDIRGLRREQQIFARQAILTYSRPDATTAS